MLPFYLYFIYPRERSERPEDWVPVKANSFSDNNIVSDEYSEIVQAGEEDNSNIVDIFSIHSANNTGLYI